MQLDISDKKVHKRQKHKKRSHTNNRQAQQTSRRKRKAAHWRNQDVEHPRDFVQHEKQKCDNIIYNNIIFPRDRMRRTVRRISREPLTCMTFRLLRRELKS